MIKQKLYLAGLFLLLVNFKSFSQSEGLSLADAWESAFTAYPGLTEKQALIKESELQKREVQNHFLPNMQLQLQNSYGTSAGTAGGFFPLPGMFNVSGSNSLNGQGNSSTNTFGSVLLDWRVFEFGRQRKAVQAAEANVEKTKSAFDAGKLALQSKISRLYIDILYAGIKLQWAKDNVVRVGEILALSKTLANEGLKPGADTLLASSSHLQTLGDLDDWTGKYQASKIRLTEVLALALENGKFSFEQFLNLDRSALETEPVTTAAHPYLEVLSQQIKNDKLREQVASRKLLPGVSILAGVSSRGSGISGDGLINKNWAAGFNNRSDNYVVGLGLTWNISNAFNSLTEKNRIKQQQLASESRLAVQSLQLNSGLQAVSSSIKEQLKQTDKTTEAVKKSKSAYELYLSRYQSGLISLTELLQIQLLLQQSEKVNIEAHQQLWEQLILHSELSGDFTYLAKHFN